MKTILGLDLGTNSIGWAYVKEAGNSNEKSEIVDAGVRIVSLSSEEISDFEKGKSVTINAARTLKRGARRNLQRYKLRRENLIQLLKENGIIDNHSILTESGKNSTHEIWRIRSKATKEKVSLDEFARILLNINKKRGYKSNRKAKNEDEGQVINSMEIAINLYENAKTPGEFVYERLLEKKKYIPEFYPSDLRKEFNRIWTFQKQFYPILMTDELRDALRDKSGKQTWTILKEPWNLEGIKIAGKREEQRLKKYELRANALNQELNLEHLAIVLQEINTQIKGTSGYLGSISDRSKLLYIKGITVGKFLYEQINKNPNSRLKSQVFFRQDYLDEFERIWEKQKEFYTDILTDDLKQTIRDVIIFYQRRLKSQKGLVSICELEGKEVEIKMNGKIKKKLIGPRVIPKSSPLFQEFKIWQKLNDLLITNVLDNETYSLSDEDRNELYNYLTIRGKMSEKEVLKVLFKKLGNWEINFKDGLEGNNTNQSFYKVFEKIVYTEGYDVQFNKMNPKEVNELLTGLFEEIGIDTKILQFNTELVDEGVINHPFYQLWHLLYSYEGDNSKTGHESLLQKLKDKFGFPFQYGKLLANINFKNDYGNLSAKAIRKILPYLKSGSNYADAALLAGYNHSHSVTVEENLQRKLQEKLELLPKNSLRNPVVEKILNQMIHVVNMTIEKYGRPDEIRVELARELKKNKKEREKAYRQINTATKKHIEITEKLKEMFPFNTGVRITRRDIIKYKLYQELESNGYKTLYTNEYIPLEKLFSKEFDVEHIIPKAILYDDSFSNKTLSKRSFNLWKSDRTAIEAMIEKYGEESDAFSRYKDTIGKLYNDGKISRAKRNKLLMKKEDIPDNFIERDLRNTQYISKKASQILLQVVPQVLATSGSITDILRSDWQLINLMKELNWGKYESLGMVHYETDKGGRKIRVIDEWSKRNDHRHHAMDAITVAFTKPAIIQYLNYKNARKNEKHKKHNLIIKIENKEFYKNEDNKLLVKPPIPLERFRVEAKKQLSKILISFKASNKVSTKNINKTKKKNGYYKKEQLTPRGQLHKESVYGKSYYYETKFEKVGSKFSMDFVNNYVAKKSHKVALLRRLSEFDDDPKKAFTGKNSLSKNPIYLDEYQSIKFPEKVKTVRLVERYTIRKEITPDINVSKILDEKIKSILEQHLAKFGNNPKKAFVNLDENPIFLNKEKEITIKRVTISGVSEVISLHTKKDHFGNPILDEEGNQIPVDFVSTGNNHHIAIYRDKQGRYQEEVVSLYEAVIRKKNKTPIIWRHHPEHPDWDFLFSLKQNEMFVFPDEQTGFNPNDIDLLDENNYAAISPHLFRLQKITNNDYTFRHQYETKIDDQKQLKGITWKRIGKNGLKDVVKVRINHLGKIVQIGE